MKPLALMIPVVLLCATASQAQDEPPTTLKDYYEQVVSTVGAGKSGENTNVSVEEGEDPYTGQATRSVIAFDPSSESRWELDFTCDDTRGMVGVSAYGGDLQKISNIELGFSPSPINDLSETVGPYQRRGDYSVVTARLRLAQDHAVISGEWRGGHQGTCVQDELLRSTFAYCQRLKASTVLKSQRIVDPTSAKANEAAAQKFGNVYEMWRWQDFDAIKISVKEGGSYVFSAEIHPKKDPFKTFFEGCRTGHAAERDRSTMFKQGLVVARDEALRNYPLGEEN